MAWAVIRVRGKVGIRSDMEETLKRLRLTRVNHCVVLPENPATEGMLKKVKDYVTWGEIDEETLEMLILKRGEWKEGGRVTKEEIEEKTGMKIKTLVKKVSNNEIKIHDILAPFRLHPPRKGYRSIKMPYKVGGALGYRGRDINDLLRRMM